MAAFNINSISWTNVSITTLYNDTTQHSLPILLNLISNSLLRLFAEHSPPSSITPPATVSPESILDIELRSHPFQQTTQPQEFNIGTFSSALFVGMIFVLIPVSLAVDMVYDREMKARNQLRVNGLSSSLYLSAYFIVLSVLMILICAALLGLVYLFDIPSFRQVIASLAPRILSNITEIYLSILAAGAYYFGLAGILILAGRYPVFNVLLLLFRPNRFGAVHPT